MRQYSGKRDAFIERRRRHSRKILKEIDNRIADIKIANNVRVQHFNENFFLTEIKQTTNSKPYKESRITFTLKGGG